MNEEDFKKKLTEEEYKVLRQKGTEAPFTGKYVNEKKSGTYKCRACGNPLFSSETKFESGTGWPSFDAALPSSVEYIEDDSHNMKRIEVVCGKCKSHLGHVFSDLPSQGLSKVSGPKTLGGKVAEKRYCINSVCLNLDPK